jgi:hypothetical protein
MNGARRPRLRIRASAAIRSRTQGRVQPVEREAFARAAEPVRVPMLVEAVGALAMRSWPDSTRALARGRQLDL